MSIITKISIGLLFLIGPAAQAQETFQLQDFLENLAENLPEDYDLSELTERFSYYQSHPLDLNNADTEKLKLLLVLSPIQISNLLAHIQKNGKLLDVLELQGIEGFDLQTISRILPFVQVNANANLKPKDLIEKSRNDLILRYGRLFHTQKGFVNLPGSRYLGSPEKLLLRYRYSYADRLSAAMTMEKDAGEFLFRGKNGLDHLSGNINFTNSGRIKRLVVGDYSIQFGQGLSMSSGLTLGKGSEVSSVAAKEMGLRPYASANESSFFRGAASTIRVNKHIDLTAFLSFRKLDASLKETESGQYTLQNINTSGLHRTVTELKNQRSLQQQLYGAALQYSIKDLRLGALAYHSQYEHNFVTGNLLYNRYSFAGKSLNNLGFQYSNTWRNLYFFGEVAHSLGTGWAVINGIMSGLSPKVSCVLVHRNYQKDYHSFYGGGLGEGADTNNEKGVYLGINYTLEKRWSLSAYADYFSFPWARYRVDTASSGYEGFGQINYTPNRLTRFLLRYKRELKPQNPDASTKLKGLQDVIKESCRLDANWSANKKFSFQQRIEITHYQKGIITEWGYMAYSDLNYKPLSSKFSGNMRLAYFSTDSYNSRIYAYEDDVLYGSGFGIYYGKGIRSFLNLKYRLISGMDIFLRYAISFYPGQEKIGSGLDELEGPIKSDIKTQLRYQF